MKIIFLDYDGVVNNLCFYDVNGEPNFNDPCDRKVNDMQAVAWLNKLCRETQAKIVVTSTWRLADDYKECLYKGGLNENVEILGRTDKIYGFKAKRGDEIQKWIDEHQDIDIEAMVILDDDCDMKHLKKYLVKTDSIIGFNYYHFIKALEMLNGKKKFKNKKREKKVLFKKIRTKIQEYRYDGYIHEHQMLVRDAFQEMFMCPDIEWTDKMYDKLLTRIEKHDESKYSKEEFDAYRKNFYPINKKEKEDNKEDFEKAWKHHYENNDHHWEARQNENFLTFETKLAIIENVCDWLAMGYKFGDRPYQYYEKNKDKINLPKVQRDYLEELIYNGIDKDYIEKGEEDDKI